MQMAFNTTSFFAGVGTVFAAITLGFAGGAMITTSPKVEPNRLERVAASAPVIAARTEAPATPLVPAIKTETPETTAAPDRVISLTLTPDSPQTLPPRPQSVMAKDDVASQIDNAKKARDAELKKEADLKKAERRAEQRRERRKQQQIQAANAVRQMRLDGDPQVVSQGDVSSRIGFFGND
jgi:type IV secretory pathway VirB10-like protein